MHRLNRALISFVTVIAGLAYLTGCATTSPRQQRIDAQPKIGEYVVLKGIYADPRYRQQFVQQVADALIARYGFSVDMQMGETHASITAKVAELLESEFGGSSVGVTNQSYSMRLTRSLTEATYDSASNTLNLPAGKAVLTYSARKQGFVQWDLQQRVKYSTLYSSIETKVTYDVPAYAIPFASRESAGNTLREVREGGMKKVEFLRECQTCAGPPSYKQSVYKDRRDQEFVAKIDRCEIRTNPNDRLKVNIDCFAQMAGEPSVTKWTKVGD